MNELPALPDSERSPLNGTVAVSLGSMHGKHMPALADGREVCHRRVANVCLEHEAGPLPRRIDPKLHSEIHLQKPCKPAILLRLQRCIFAKHFLNIPRTWPTFALLPYNPPRKVCTVLFPSFSWHVSQETSCSIVAFNYLQFKPPISTQRFWCPGSPQLRFSLVQHKRKRQSG